MPSIPRAAVTVLIIAALLCLLSAAAFAAEEWRIGKISLCGMKKVSAGEVKRNMETPFPSFFAWLPRVALPGFNEGMLQADLEAIRRLYESKGYYSATVDSRITRDRRKMTVKVRLCVEEGMPALVNTVGFDFRGELDDALQDGTRRLSRLRPGKTFAAKAYQDSERDMEDFLSNHGYPEPRVSGEAVVNKSLHTADIAFIVVPGEQRFFGPVHVTGLVQVREPDVLRELTFREGELFSAGKLFRSQRNIYQLGLFNSVVLNTQGRGKGAEIPVEVSFDESKKRRLELGAGYGTEDRLRARASWSRLYFLGRVSTLNTSLRYSSLLWSADVNYNQPYFVQRGQGLFMRFGYDREFAVSYSNEKISSQVRVNRALAGDLNAFLAYNLEVNRPLSASSVQTEALLAANPGDYYFISGPIGGLEWSTVQDAMSPRTGEILSLYAEAPLRLFGSALDYLKVYFSGRAYREVSPGYVLAARANVGLIRPYRFTQTIPIYKRFFLGGSSSVRGYPYQGVGPTDATGAPLGGDYMALGNLELRYPVYRRLGGVVFLDAGNVYQNRFDFDLPGLKYSVGGGVRYETLVGPVRFDAAFPFDSADSPDITRYRLYLSLGPVF
ncbi:MAG: BamA/TamA family outer membrane protein [Endomicrobiales bacterium]